MIEYLQVGYIADEFERIEGRKTAVDPNPNKEDRYYINRHKDASYKHHIFHDTFIEFTRYIPNKYDVIKFNYSPTMFELKQAKRILNTNGEIIAE